MKNVDIVYCTERSQGSAANYNAYGRAMGIQHYAGYGYNWGPWSWRGGGLLGQQMVLPSGQSYLLGTNLSAVDSPAETFAYGETYDTPRMTVGIGFSADTFDGTRNKELRHGGSWPFGFVDGHAKAVAMRSGFIAGAFNDRFVLPKNMTIATRAYCINPSVMISENAGTSNLNTIMPNPIRCDQVGPWIMANLPPCGPSDGPGSNCIFND
jgi:prepilin-type processing-associated H-X9-DG protein